MDPNWIHVDRRSMKFMLQSLHPCYISMFDCELHFLNGYIPIDDATPPCVTVKASLLLLQSPFSSLQIRFVLVHFDSSVQQMSCVNPNSSWLNLHFLMANHHVWLKMGSAPSKNITSNIHQPWDVYRFSSIFRQTNSLLSKMAIES